MPWEGAETVDEPPEYLKISFLSISKITSLIPAQTPAWIPSEEEEDLQTPQKTWETLHKNPPADGKTLPWISKGSQ